MMALIQSCKLETGAADAGLPGGRDTNVEAAEPVAQKRA